MRVIYEGRVQGVGFRWTVKNLAKEYDVAGTVRNLADGRVELCARGDGDEVSRFLEGIRASSLAGHIVREDAEPLPDRGGLRGFVIIE